MKFRELGINKRELQHFQELIEQANGHVMVLVHPFFDELTMPNFQSQNPFLKERYEEYRRRLVNTINSSKIPIIILDPPSKTKYDKKQVHQKNMIFFPTFENNPHLLNEQNLETLEAKRAIGDEDAHNLIDLLSELGVRKIFLGGNYSINQPPKLFSRKDLREFRKAEKKAISVDAMQKPLGKVISKSIFVGCLGATYRKLLIFGGNKFKINLMTNLTYPDKQEYSKIHGLIKRFSRKLLEKRNKLKRNIRR